MFKRKPCAICAEKDKVIELLKAQNKDLYDRLMAFNEKAFTYYKAETKSGEPLYPVGIDKDGKEFSYKDVNIKEAQDEVYRAFGEEMIMVEEKK